MKKILLTLGVAAVLASPMAIAKKPNSTGGGNSLKAQMHQMVEASDTLKTTQSPHEALVAITKLRNAAKAAKTIVPKTVKGDKASVEYYRESYDQIIEIANDMEKQVKAGNMAVIRPMLRDLAYVKAAGHRSFKN